MNMISNTQQQIETNLENIVMEENVVLFKILVSIFFFSFFENLINHISCFEEHILSSRAATLLERTLFQYVFHILDDLWFFQVI